MNLPAAVAANALPKDEQVGIRLALAIDQARILADHLPEALKLFPDNPKWQDTFGQLIALIDGMVRELEASYAILTDAPPTVKGRLQ